MIPFASQRGGGQDLATHLQNAYDNELTEVVEIRGAVAGDLHGAFKEWEVQAETLTRCRKYLYSMSINPDPAQGELTRAQYLDYISRAETALGLANQPRAVVFHVKHGREHCHVVWSRVDAENQKAVHIAFDREKLMQVTRTFARENFLDLPAGYDKSRHKGQDTLYERAQRNETGLSKEDHQQRVTEAWQHSDDAKSFVQALAEQGYILARGKRPYVVVDAYGGMHALSKLILDKEVKTKEVRAYLEKDFPEDSLPTVEEAEELITKHRQFVERSRDEDRMAGKLAALKHAQALRRLAVEQEAHTLRRQHHEARGGLIAAQRDERHALRREHIARMEAVRVKRHEMRASGLASFLGNVTGVSAIRRAIHRYQDSKRLAAQREERAQLQKRQAEERRGLDDRQRVQAAAMDRKVRDLQKVEKREVASLKRDDLREQRTEARGRDNAMVSLEQVAGLNAPPQRHERQDLQTIFTRARDQEPEHVPDLLETFNRAADDRRPDASGHDDQRRDIEREPDGPQRTR